MKECLFNTCSNNVVGYCRYHHASMTVKQMKCKNCLQKECRHLVKNEERIEALNADIWLRMRNTRIGDREN